jgi:hypothetical protein
VLVIDLPVDRSSGAIQLTFDVSGPDDGLLRVLETEIDGRPNAALSMDETECRSDIAVLDGQPLPMRLQGSLDDVLAGATLDAEACNPITLREGSHSFESDGALLVDGFQLTSEGRRPEGSETGGTLTIEERSSTGLHARVRATEDVWLLTGSSYTPEWSAAADDEVLDPPVSLDLQAAFKIAPQPLEQRVDVTYAPQRAFDRLLMISGVVVALCVVIILANPLDRETRWVPRHVKTTWVAPLAVDVVAVVLSFGIGGITAALLAVILVAGQRSGRVQARDLLWVTAVMIVVGTAAYLPPLGPDLDPFGLDWAQERTVANAVFRFAVIFLIGALSADARSRVSSTRRANSVMVPSIKEIAP